MNTAGLIFSGWLIVAASMFGLWMVAFRQKNAGWVDVGWSLTLVLLVAWFAVWSDGVLSRRILYAALVGAWGLRLAFHILKRLGKESHEDPRYAYLRDHWQGHADRNFFLFFQAQGLANVLLAIPILVLMRFSPGDLTPFDLAGIGLILAAVAGETLSDRQLAAFRADPANRGKTCRVGLWGYSRHPNYFFEWMHWVGYPVLGLSLFQSGAGVWWPVTLLGPLVMLVLLLQFTGIPYTEKQALKSRGEDYRRYQREVSAFFPWFPKKPDQTPL